jgi:membrane-associated protein
MEQLIQFLYQAAPYVHFVSFGLLLLAGFSLPVSEDIVIIVSASIAATIKPENTVIIFLGCFLGAYLGDWVPYIVGRFGGPRLLRIPFFARIFPREKIEKIELYFSKYQVKTLFFGRFIPFGVRNALFFTSGLTGVRFTKFILIDLCALCITSTIQFSTGYMLGDNFRDIFPYLNRYKLIIISLLSVFIVFMLVKNKFMTADRDKKKVYEPEL